MATRKQSGKKGTKKAAATVTAASEPAASQPPDTLPAPDTLPQAQKKKRRDAIVQADEVRQEIEPARRDELRVNMMRSLVTEPLLSKVQQNPRAKYEVIVALNELFVGGID